MLRLKDPSVSVKNFYDTIHFHLDEMAPFKKVTLKQYRLMLKPWITKEILKKCDERNKLLKLIKEESEPDKIVALRKEYKILRNKITDEKRNSKKAHYTDIFCKLRITPLKFGKKLDPLLISNLQNLLVSKSWMKIIIYLVTPNKSQIFLMIIILLLAPKFNIRFQLKTETSTIS